MKREGMRSRIVFAGIVIVILGATIFGAIEVSAFLFHRKEVDLQRHRTQTVVAESSEKVSQVLQLQHSVSATIGEIITKDEGNIKAITDAVIPIAGTDLPVEERRAIQTYLEDLAEISRLQLSYHRAMLLSNAASDIAMTAQKAANLVTNDLLSNIRSFTDAETRGALDRSDQADKDSARALDAFLLTEDRFAAKLKSLRLALARYRAAASGYRFIDEKILTDGEAMLARATK